METPVEYNAGKTEKTQKKDRIYVFTDKFVCENCKDWYEHIDPLDSPDCTECAPADFPYITRQEAIEKIAKGIHYYEWSWNKKQLPIWKDLNEYIQNDYKRQAEFALNALLGE